MRANGVASLDVSVGKPHAAIKPWPDDVPVAAFGALRLQLPVPGQNLFKVLDGVIGGPCEHIGQPGLWIDVVKLRRLCRAPNYAERLWNDALSRRVCGPARTD